MLKTFRKICQECGSTWTGHMTPDYCAQCNAPYTCWEGLYIGMEEVAKQQQIRAENVEKAIAELKIRLERSAINPSDYINGLEGRINGLLNELNKEKEAHAQLQARCFDQGGTFSNVFGEIAALRARLENDEHCEPASNPEMVYVSRKRLVILEAVLEKWLDNASPLDVELVPLAEEAKRIMDTILMRKNAKMSKPEDYIAFPPDEVKR